MTGSEVSPNCTLVELKYVCSVFAICPDDTPNCTLVELKYCLPCYSE